MIIIGSQANAALASQPRRGEDFDFMIHQSEMQTVLKELTKNATKFVVHKSTDDQCTISTEFGIWEFFIGHSNNSTEQLLEYCRNSADGDIIGSERASIDVQYCLKLSHKYLRNSPHFLKTMNDIETLKKQGAILTPTLEKILKLREEETYNYKHPDLSVSKGSFFNGDDVPYKYDHDTIHKAIAVGKQPAYLSYMKDGAEVQTSKEKFFAASEYTRLLGVYEEACVLALERSQIPFALEADGVHENPPTPKQSFVTALMKVCTSITSGWFREYAYDNFHQVIRIYRKFGEDYYVKQFQKNRSVLEPYKNGTSE